MRMTKRQKNKRLYSIWKGVKQRCCQPSHKDYYEYGNKGICICDEWKDFENFYEWSIKNNYDDTLTIDRIDNSNGYSPTNCRWVSKKEQARNRTSNRKITYNGTTKIAIEWAEYLGMPKNTFLNRLYRGWSIEKSIKTPILKGRTK